MGSLGLRGGVAGRGGALGTDDWLDPGVTVPRSLSFGGVGVIGIGIEWRMRQGGVNRSAWLLSWDQ